MFYRVIASRAVLAVTSLIVVAVAVRVCVLQLEHLAGFAGSSGLDLVLEEDIAIILVAFGVFLEEREYFVEKVFGEAMPDKEHAINAAAMSAGVVCLLVGLAMEVVDQLYEAAVSLGPETAAAAVTTVLALHIVSILTLLRFLWKLR